MSKIQLLLQVPFAAKDQAKALGARWDPAARAWYVPHGLDLQRFRAWWPAGLDSAAPGAALSATRPAAGPGEGAAAAVFTGPDRIAPDTSDRLPWEE